MKKCILSIMVALIFLSTKFAVSQIVIGQQYFRGVCAGYNGGDSAMYGGNDAAAMAAALANYKFWDANTIQPLINSYATKNNIMQYVQSMPRNGTTNLFYYAGHGGSKKFNESGNPQCDGLLPYKYPDYTLAELGDTNFRITPYQLGQWLNASSYFNIVVYLDACHSGMFPARIVTQGVISSACKEEESTLDDRSTQHGWYTRFLLEALQNPAITSAKGVHQYAATNIPLYEGAHPQINSQSLDQNIAGPTLSGTFIRSEEWYSPLALRGNVIVPSSYSLKLDATVNLNVNNCSIISSGGTLTVQSGATINCTYLNQGSVVKGLYPNISQALSAAVSGQTIIVTGTNSLSSNLSIPTGVTLTINSGASVNLSSYSIVSTGGAINLYGNVTCTYLKQSGVLKGLFPTIQSAVNYSSSGQTVELQSRTHNESFALNSKSGIHISGAGISSTTINGSVNFSNSQNCHLENLTVTNNISLNYGTYYNYLENLTVQGWIAPNMGSSTVITNATMTTSNYYGICGGYCTVSAGSSQIKHKSSAGISASAMNMACDLVTLCNNAWDVRSNGGTNNINFGNCTFSGSIPGSTINSPGVSWNVWTYCGGLSKEAATSDNASSPQIKELSSGLDGLNSEDKLAGQGDYENVMVNYRTLFDKIRKENDDKIIDFKQYEKELTDVVSQFKDVIKKYPGSVSSVQSLQEVISCYRLLQNQQSAKQIVKNLLADKKYSNILSHIRFLSIPLFIDDQDYDGALSLCDTVISEMPNTLEGACLLYNKWKILETLKNDKTNAEKMYKKLREQYPNSMYAFLTDGSLGKETIPQTSQDVQKVDKYKLNNYPNPFNPTTVINYQLPEASQVSLRVYDILGREVATLVNEMKGIGSYSATFDGEKLASGIYIIQLVAHSEEGKSFVQTKKMQLVK